MRGILWNKEEVLQLLWDETPMTTEETQAHIALIEQHLSSLILYYSRRRKVTALEQVKKHREEGQDTATFSIKQAEDGWETLY